MKDVNRVILVGRLGNDPVQRETKNGLAVVHFSLATSRRVSESGNANEGTEGSEAKEKEETQWHRIVVWGKQAEACKLYLNKGRAVYVEGMLRSRKYTHKDGEPRYTFEIHAENVTFLGAKRRDEGDSHREESATAALATA